MEKPTIFCPFCGKELLENNTQFCGNCGRNLNPSTNREAHVPTHDVIRPMPGSPDSQTPSTSIPHTPSPNPPSEYPRKRPPSPNRRNLLKLGGIGIASVAVLTAVGAGTFVLTHQPSSQSSHIATPTSQTATTPTPTKWEERSLARPALTV